MIFTMAKTVVYYNGACREPARVGYNVFVRERYFWNRACKRW